MEKGTGGEIDLRLGVAADSHRSRTFKAKREMADIAEVV
jgi:hypothetical protein